jgi:hypothetical protein
VVGSVEVAGEANMSRASICLAVSCFFGVVGLGGGTGLQPEDSGETPHLPAGAIRQLDEVRLLNAGHVLTVAFSPDGKSLAVGSWDGTVKLWDVATGKKIRQLPEHRTPVTRVEYSSDGKVLLSNGQDGTLGFWDTADGKQLRLLKDLPPISNFRLAPNGNFLATTHRGNLQLWNMKTEKMQFQLSAKQQFNRLLGFTPDSGKMICLGYREQRMKIVFRDTETGKQMAESDTGKDNIIRGWLGPALSSTARRLLFNDWPDLFLYDLGTGRTRPAKPANKVSSAAFSPNAKMFAFVESDEVIHVWETATLKERCRFQGRENGRIPLAFSPDGKILASGSTDNSVFLWDVTGIRTGRIAREEPTAQDMQTLWTDLMSTDAARAYRAMSRMMAAPQWSLPFLKKNIQPSETKIEPRLMARLLEDLGNEQFPVRKKALDDLGKMGAPAEPFLQKALAKTPILEVRRRLQQLLARIDEERFNPSAADLRIIRAIEVVESIDNPVAEKMLKQWGAGTPGPLLTREAGEALENRARKKSR